MSTALIPSTDELKARLWKRLDKLPQRDAIDTSDATQWIDYMSHIMPREAEWHMVRAGGVGGSEIGGLVRNYMGQMADHEFSAPKWAEGKLLRRVPDLPKGVTERGHFMEPLIAERLYQELRTSRDLKAYDALAAAQGKRIWMRYSPDDIIILDQPTSLITADGVADLHGRVLVDYKAPTVVEDAPKISFQYVCQLHQGALLCMEQGIDITTTMLTQFDWAKFELKNDIVEIVPELCELIPVAGDHYWDYVMRGEIPPPVIRKRAHVDEQTRKETAELAARIGQVNAMRTALSNLSDSLRDDLIKRIGLDNTRLDGQTIKYPGSISIGARTVIDAEKTRQALGEDGITGVLVKETTKKYNVDALVARLEELGEDTKPYREIKKIDPSLAIEALIDKGFDPEEFVAESPIIRVDRNMKDQAQDWLEESFPPLDLPPVVQDEDLIGEALEPAFSADRPRNA